MQRRPKLPVQVPHRLMLAAGASTAIVIAASCGERQVTGPSTATSISAPTVAIPTSSGCRSFQVTLGTGNTISVDSVALSWCGGFIKGPLRPEVSGTPTFDRASGTVRIPIVLRNSDTVSVGTVARTVTLEDSVFVITPTGLKNRGTGGPYVHFTNWDSAGSRLGVWHYAPLRSGTIAPQYLPPKTISQVKWVEMHVLSNVSKYQFMMWGTAPMVPNDTIHVHLDGGLTGHPSKDTIVHFGVAVPYAYTVRTGYSAPMLINNNASIPLSGNIITDSARVLTGWAPQIIVVTPEIQPLYIEIHGLLTATDPVTSFQRHITNSVALYRQVGDAEFRRRMQIAATAAIDPIRDSAAIRRLETALNGNEFVVLPRLGSGVSPIRRPNGEVSASRVGVSANLVPGVSTDSAEPTAFVYVNGIFTSDADVGTEGILSTLLSEVSEIRSNSRMSLSWVFNYTRNQAKPSTEAEIEADCAIYAAEWSPDSPRFTQALWDCRKLLTNPQEWDLAEAIQQRILLSFTAAVPEADAIRLETKIMSHHASGEHVIIVAHSQGNMMAQTAINSLINSRQIDPTKDSACVGALALAAPSGAHWPLDANHLKQVSVAGDFVASLNGWTATYTPLSRSADSAMALTSPLVSPFAWFNAWMYWRTAILHNVNNSYLGQSATKTMIEADLDLIYRECTVGKVIALMPTEASFIPRGGYLPVTTQVNNRNGRQIFGRKLQWWSADSTIARVDTNGSWFGVHPGTTKIVARSWQDTAATAVRASTHQTGLEGHWQGSYLKADGVTFAYSTLDLSPGGTSGTLRYQWHSTSYNSVPVRGTAIGDSLSATAVLTYTAIEDSAFVHFPCHNRPCITTLTITAGAGDQWTGLAGRSQDEADMSITTWSWTRVP